MSIQFKLSLFLCGVLALILSSTANAKTFYQIKVKKCTGSESNLLPMACSLATYKTWEGKSFKEGSGWMNTKSPQLIAYLPVGSKSSQRVDPPISGLWCPPASQHADGGNTKKRAIAKRSLLETSVNLVIACRLINQEKRKEDESEGADQPEQGRCKNPRSRQVRHVCWEDGFRRRGRR